MNKNDLVSVMETVLKNTPPQLTDRFFTIAVESKSTRDYDAILKELILRIKKGDLGMIKNSYLLINKEAKDLYQLINSVLNNFKLSQEDYEVLDFAKATLHNSYTRQIHLVDLDVNYLYALLKTKMDLSTLILTKDCEQVNVKHYKDELYKRLELVYHCYDFYNKAEIALINFNNLKMLVTSVLGANNISMTY